jgi:diaminopimelate decarboxylase
MDEQVVQATAGSEASGMGETNRMWWTHPGLTARGGRLLIAGRDADALARHHGTPLYVYDLARIGEQIEALQAALDRAKLARRVRVALKAQHEPEVLAYIHRRFPPGAARGVGLDVCSPGELLHALDCGWPAEHISYTGTNVSERDLDVLLQHPIHINLDGMSQLRRFGARAPGRRIGIRLNPRAGVAHGLGAVSLYSGDKPTKFGIYPEQLEDAVAVASEFGLPIVTVHAHVSRMVLTEDLPHYENVLKRVAALAAQLQKLGCPIEEVNMGGGLGVPTAAGDQPLDLDAVASLWKQYLEPLGVTVGCENGEFFSRESGVLLSEVVSVEDRDGVCFVGLDAGWNVFNLPFVYGQSHDVVLCRAVTDPLVRRVTIAGHINQGQDLFTEDYPFPAVVEGDIVAILGAGAYGQSSSLNTHCLRPHARAVFLEDRLATDCVDGPTPGLSGVHLPGGSGPQ